ncbi:MAG: carboxypeptidase regulatory-like domain-containing protein, partial [Terracidiphilus sp.]
MNRIQSTFLSLLLILGVLAGENYAKAQTSLGTLVGTARDKSGAVISHANLSITNQATGQIRTGTTNGEGVYRFDAVPPGPYTIEFEAAGFEKIKAKDIQVTASTVTSYDVTVVLGTKQETVTVEADQAAINTENGQLAGVVGSVELDKLPVFTLNPIELAMTVPGVEPVANGTGAFENGVNIQVNGARPRANNFLLDGQEINDVGITGQAFQPQIPDMFEAVTVITSSASAEYGRAGGGIVNTTTKSGSNTPHGSVFERYTGSGLNSIPGGDRGPTAVTGYEKPRSDEHSYGFTGGGAILKNKLFVYGALELQRFYGMEQPGVNLLPDAAGYATLQTINGSSAPQIALLDGYLSNGAYLTQDNSFPSTVTKNVGNLPGCPVGGCVITFAGFERPNQAEVNPDTQWSYRADYKPWDRDSIFFRYLHDRTSLTPDFFNNPNALLGFDTQQGGPSELGEGGWTHIFTPTLLNEFRVSEARIAFTFAPTAATLANPLNDLPTLTFANTSGATAVGTVSFPSLGPNQNFPQGREEDLYQFQDTGTLTKGRQTMRLGADIGRLIEVDLVSQNALGSLGFQNGGNATTSLGNFLINQLGASGSATKVFGPTRADSHGYRNGVFFQDDVKVHADLTLNLGLRWDYLSNPENSLKYPGVDPNNPLAPIPTFVPIENDWTNISPRIGFAYSPHGKFGVLGDGKTVLRGGFGVFYDSTFSNILVNSTQAAPVSSSGLIQQVGTASPGPATGLIPTISPAISQHSTVESVPPRL